MSDEGSHFLMNPSNASFISYRNDSKYGAPTPSSSSSLTSYKENLAQYLEIENAMKVEDAYSKIYQRAESKVVNSRDITNPSISESSMLSENYHPPKHTNPTLANYTATERQEEKARSVTKKQDYLIHVTPVDELYRKRLEDLREAHQLMPVKDGREHAVPDDDRGPTQGNNGKYGERSICPFLYCFLFSSSLHFTLFLLWQWISGAFTQQCAIQPGTGAITRSRRHPKRKVNQNTIAGWAQRTRQLVEYTLHTRHSRSEKEMMVFLISQEPHHLEVVELMLMENHGQHRRVNLVVS